MIPLILVHGRSQQNKDPKKLKQEWVDAWTRGLKAAGLKMPFDNDADIRFAYYGDALDDLVSGKPDNEVADIIIKGAATEDRAQAAIRGMLKEMYQAAGLTPEQLAEALPADVQEKGWLNHKWVLGVMKVIDRYVPNGSGAAVALATSDVYMYTAESAKRKTIDDGVLRAFRKHETAVVVSHSLGTIVAYNILKQTGSEQGWTIPLFMTLGSPLAVSYVKQWLSPTKRPTSIGDWFNARDPKDFVALYPLSTPHFFMEGGIDHKNDVHNDTDNHHGITGYLSDPVIAKRIYDAVTQAAPAPAPVA